MIDTHFSPIANVNKAHIPNSQETLLQNILKVVDYHSNLEASSSHVAVWLEQEIRKVYYWWVVLELTFWSCSAPWLSSYTTLLKVCLHNMRHNICGNSIALPLTVDEIIKINLSKWSQIQSLTFKNRLISWATTSPNMSPDGVLMA